MSLFNFFKHSSDSDVKKYSLLHEKLEKEYPFLGEKELVLTGCIAGLLARVALVDLVLDKNEIGQIKSTLKDWNINEQIHCELIANIAIKHIEEMSGLENHLYVYPLKENLKDEDKYRVLQSLFLVAASDGKIAGIESEEIRIITKGLGLSNQHFLSARAEMAQYIAALK